MLKYVLDNNLKYKFKNSLVFFLKSFFRIFFAPIFVFLIIILRPLIRIRVGKLNSSRIGHLSINTAKYYINNKWLKKNNYIDFFYCDKLIANKYLLSLWEKKINILPRLFLFSIYGVIMYFKYTKRYHYADNNEGGDMDPENVIDKFDPVLSVPEKDLIKGRAILNKMNPENRKIILFFSRDDAYTDFLLTNNIDIRFHSYRNANIDSFQLAAEELSQKGYTLIRVGSQVKKKIKFNSQYIIDYSNSVYQSDFMDIYLQSVCEFFITTGSGINSVAHIFKKPLLYVSFSPYGYSPTDISRLKCIYKKVFDTSKNKFLPLSEMFERGIAQAYNTDFYIKNNITLIDNTSEEIRDACVEMLDSINCNFQISEHDKNIHAKFWDIYYESVQKYAIDRLGNRESYRMQIGNKFLKDNLYLLD